MTFTMLKMGKQQQQQQQTNKIKVDKSSIRENENNQFIREFFVYIMHCLQSVT